MSGSTTTAILAQEAARMGDLAQAIVSLARSAEKRRGARAELIDATDTIAKAIRKELRSGDRIEIPQGGTIPDPKKYHPTVTYEAARVRRPAQVYHDALLRRSAILGLSEAQGEYIDEQNVVLRPATAEERESFIAEVDALIKAFNELLEKQAVDFDSAAKKATKLTPR